MYMDIIKEEEVSYVLSKISVETVDAQRHFEGIMQLRVNQDKYLTSTDNISSKMNGLSLTTGQIAYEENLEKKLISWCENTLKNLDSVTPVYIQRNTV